MKTIVVRGVTAVTLDLTELEAKRLRLVCAHAVAISKFIAERALLPDSVVYDLLKTIYEQLYREGV